MITLQMSEAAHAALKNAILAGALATRHQHLYLQFDAATAVLPQGVDNPRESLAEAQCLIAAAEAVMSPIDEDQAVIGSPLSGGYIAGVVSDAHKGMMLSSVIRNDDEVVVRLARLYKQLTGTKL